MDLRKLKTILDLFEHSSIQELEITEGEEKIKLTKNQGTATQVATQAINIPSPNPVVQIPTTTESPVTDLDEAPQLEEGIVQLTSPMVGTYYSRPNPDEDNFVTVGDHVNEGDTVCVIEAMKLFNNVGAPVTGTVKSIEVKNEDAVGFGDLLLTFKAD